MRADRKNLSFSRWMVERERFHLPSDARQFGPDRSAPLTEALPAALRELGIEKDVWARSMQTDWASIVGPQVAKRTRPGGLDRGCLTIFVSHSAWLMELSRYGQKPLLDNLQAKYGPDRIRSIRLLLDPDKPRG